LAENTRKAYATGLGSFAKFRAQYELEPVWPPSIDSIVLFVAWASIEGFTYRTVRLYVSAIGFHCKVKQCPDVSTHYVIQKALDGLRKDGRGVRTRLPITHSILGSILLSLPSICINVYETRLFVAAYTLAFFAFLRVGELAAKTKVCYKDVISISDVRMQPDGNSFVLVIRNSKTDQLGFGTTLRICSTGRSLCPVKSMRLYLQQRPPFLGALLCHFNGAPLTRYEFTAVLKRALTRLKLEYSNYTSHSFRIGAATAAAMSGCSAEVIKQAGRWRSEAYRVYIKPESVYTLPILS